MTTSRTAHEWKVLAAMASLYLIWGSTYLGIRFAIETLPPFLMAGPRFIISGVLLYVWQRGQGASHPTRVHWRSALIIGALMLVGGNGGVTWAEQRVPSSLAALIIGAVPIWAVLLNWLAFDRVRPNRRLMAGLLVGIGGLTLLIAPWNTSGDEAVDMLGALVIMGAALCWATGSLYSRRATLPDVPLMATGIEMIAGGVLLIGIGVASGELNQLHLAEVSLRSALAFGYLTAVGSLIAFTAYIWLLKNTTTARATSYAYASPVVAVFLGWALAGEAITPRMLVAAAIIIGAVMTILDDRSSGEEKSARAADAPAAVEADRPAVPQSTGAR